MSEDTLLPFDLPSVARKKLSVGFDGGQLSSDAGVLLLRGIEKKLGLAARLASCIRDRRKPERIEHPLEKMLRLPLPAVRAFAVRIRWQRLPSIEESYCRRGLPFASRTSRQ
jgi:Transposase DDE domain group 1